MREPARNRSESRFRDRLLRRTRISLDRSVTDVTDSDLRQAAQIGVPDSQHQGPPPEPGPGKASPQKFSLVRLEGRGSLKWGFGLPPEMIPALSPHGVACAPPAPEPVPVLGPCLVPCLGLCALVLGVEVEPSVF
jgi:hypothetical protein